MLKNKTAIITGCSRGIGRAVLELFLSNNANVIACSRKYEGDKFIDLKKKFKDRLKFFYFDLQNIEEVREQAKLIISQNNEIDILVNNAGAIHTSLFQMTKIEDMKALFDINFFSQLAFTQIIIKKLIKSKYASIINISSNAALDFFEGRISYSATKSALITASKILSKELGRYKIRVNCVAPGLTDTDLMKDSHSDKLIEETINKTSLRKIAKPNDIAELVLFLASNNSRHITGEVIRIDGGL